MLLAGDEIGRTQHGNNNAYCQDNEISWLDWEGADLELLAFVRRLSAFRHSHPIFHQRRWFQGRPLRRDGVSDIAWFSPAGEPMTDGDWGVSFAKSVGSLPERRVASGRRRTVGAVLGRQLLPRAPPLLGGDLVLPARRALRRLLDAGARHGHGREPVLRRLARPVKAAELLSVEARSGGACCRGDPSPPDEDGHRQVGEDGAEIEPPASGDKAPAGEDVVPAVVRGVSLSSGGPQGRRGAAQGGGSSRTVSPQARRPTGRWPREAISRRGILERHRDRRLPAVAAGPRPSEGDDVVGVDAGARSGSSRPRGRRPPAPGPAAAGAAE